MRSREMLNQYLHSLGIQPPLEPSLAALQEIVYHHPYHYPFETIHPFSGLPVSIELDEVFTKIVLHKRGGYCFEQNLLLKFMLEEIGFEVTGIGARVLVNQPPENITRKSHYCLVVRIDEAQYLVDVGFGVNALNIPIKIQVGLAQQTEVDTYDIVMHKTGDFLLRLKNKNKWRILYQFNLIPQLFVDLEMYNWYTSTNPNAGLVKNLTIVLLQKNKRLTLHNNLYKEHLPNGESISVIFKEEHEIVRCIQEKFNLDLTEKQTEKLKKAIQLKIFNT